MKTISFTPEEDATAVDIDISDFGLASLSSLRYDKIISVTSKEPISPQVAIDKGVSVARGGNLTTSDGTSFSYSVFSYYTKTGAKGWYRFVGTTYDTTTKILHLTNNSGTVFAKGVEYVLVCIEM